MSDTPDIDPSLLPIIGSDDGPTLADVVFVSGAITTGVGAGYTALKNPKALMSLATQAGRLTIQYGGTPLARGLGSLALGTVMNTASATAAQKAGMDSDTGRTLNALTTLGLNSAVNKGLLSQGFTGRMASALFKKGLVGVPNELTKLPKLRGTIAGMAVGTAVAGTAVELVGKYTPLLTGFGASREQTARHAEDFNRLHLTEGVSIPNIDPVTSVIRTVDAFGDLADYNQEERAYYNRDTGEVVFVQNHGDDFLDAAKFTGDQIGDRVEEVTGSKLLGGTADVAATTIVGATEVVGAVGGAALDYVVEPVGDTIGGGARALFDFLTPW